MSKTAHTPGPWVIETETKGFEVCTIHGVERQPTEDGLGQSWVYVRPPSLYRDGEWHWPDETEQLANARLIAAAPDMLKALEKLLTSAKLLLQNAEGCAVNHYGDDYQLHGVPGWLADCHADIETAEAAISEATGGDAS